ncbi:thiamine-binding protein [Polluticoccus soli]|uniref:thiamine-binding protein n=1 Tax=Polluticoccus soli TaxID=3034150 RepID=UPI0023E2CE0C|nr:thiamine-binding protein [Flavipsychrobacter sp. JY13-12]
MNNIVNLAIQVLPLEKSRQEAYTIIDKAIATINASGLKYVVSPFETVIEGPYDKVMQLLNDIQTACYEGGADSLLINMKLHTSKVTDMAINDKIGKYKDQ